MFIELVDALRCPHQHEESWLVASADRMEHRHIVDGRIGCPVCSAEFPIRAGVVDFRASPSAAVPQPIVAGAGVAMRIAALLGLTDHTGFAVLLGEWGAYAGEVAGVAETPLIVIDPPADVTGAPGVSVLRCDGELPLATGAARGIAVDARNEARMASALRAVRTGGRILAPVALLLPPDVTELARDDALWVGERGPRASPLLSLHVRRA